MASDAVYRTEGGLILRIVESPEGELRVHTLSGDAWIEGRIGMVGLRLAPTTTQLTRAEIAALPA